MTLSRLDRLLELALRWLECHHEHLKQSDTVTRHAVRSNWQVMDALKNARRSIRALEHEMRNDAWREEALRDAEQELWEAQRRLRYAGEAQKDVEKWNRKVKELKNDTVKT